MTNTIPIILASKSTVRGQLLQNAGIPFTAVPGRVDEETIKSSLMAEKISPRDIVDYLAEEKARKISQKHSEAIVIGADQIMWHDKELIGKPKSPEDLRLRLQKFSGTTHDIYTGAVIYQNGQPQWRHVERVKMNCRELSPEFIDDYVLTNWTDVQFCAGGYMIESTGIRLFSHIQGDYFSILGLPITAVINYLSLRGIIKL